MHSMHVRSGSICVCIFYTVYICYACVNISEYSFKHMCVCVYVCVCMIVCVYIL